MAVTQNFSLDYDETIQVTETWEDGLEPEDFLSTFFSVGKNGFFNTEMVEFQVRRRQEQVAIAVEDISTGYRLNVQDRHSVKRVPPPIFKEQFTINSYKLMEKEFGGTPYDNPEFMGALMNEVSMGIQEMDWKIRRSQELEAAQVLTTGEIELTDGEAVPKVIYTADYSKKSALHPTAGTAWDNSGGDPLGDMNRLAIQMRTLGKVNATDAIMSPENFEAIIQREDVQKRFDNRRMELGTFPGMSRMNNGGTLQGRLQIGSYMFNIWTYENYYQETTGPLKRYLPASSCILLNPEKSKLTKFFGAIPNMAQVLGVPHHGRNLIPVMPPRMTSEKNGVDIFINAWLDEKGENLNVGVGTRPLYVPLGIDTFGHINTRVS